ncbi:MAG: DUF6528 family protein [Pirellulales bacterium]
MLLGGHLGGAAEPAVPQLLCAGGAEVFLLDATAAEAGTINKLWSWTASVEHGVPEDQLKRFKNLDECKPLDGGKLILICTSNSGCGLIDRAKGKLIWSAAATNAHSVERLPGERIVVASSLSGDKLLLFDMRGDASATAVWSAPLKSAHGLVWDEQRKSLWTLGFNELRRYTLKDWETKTPSLDLQNTWPLPDDDGHDLRPMPEGADLLVTTEKHVWLFDRVAEKFRKHPHLGDTAGVKAIDVHPTTGRIAYSLWGQTFSLHAPAADVAVKGNTIYKVRWFVEENGKK